MKKLFAVVMVAFAMFVGFGAVSSGTAEARQDVWVCAGEGGRGAIYIDKDSATLITHTSGKGVDDYYKIRANFYSSSGAGWSATYEVMFAGDQIQVFDNGRNIYPLSGLKGNKFKAAWYYSMGYQFE